MNLLRARPLPNAARPLGTPASCSQVGRHSRSWARTMPPQASVAGDQKPASRWSEVWMGSMPLDGFHFFVDVLPGPLATAASVHSFVALKSQNTEEICASESFHDGSRGSQLRLDLDRVVDTFNMSWDPKLTLLTHNCSHYSEALAKHLAVRNEIAIT
eukprot:gene14395-20397_t